MALPRSCGPVSPAKLAALIARAKRLDRDYRRLMGRPLGVVGEVAEYEAARLLDLKLCAARQPGFDLFRGRGRAVRRYQVKGRVRLSGTSHSQRVGSIRLSHPWDAVLLVLLDEELAPVAIYEATRKAIVKALGAPGSRARNVRGQLAVSKFKAIGRCVWSVPKA
jgi:hypothetical protein